MAKEIPRSARNDKLPGYFRRAGLVRPASRAATLPWRLRSIVWSGRTSRAVWFVWTLGLTLFFVRMAAVDLENFRPVSSDEVAILSVSYKLATHGIFGSDVYTGFYNADQHYFMNLPAQHVWQAIVFRLFGAGVSQSRWVSLASGLALIWIVSWMSYRWYGLMAAIGSSGLLVLWRSDLTGAHSHLPLLDASRSGRYDVGAVMWIWMSIAFLDWTLRKPGRLKALAAGMCAGLASLTQFFGAFALPLLAAAWLWQPDKRSENLSENLVAAHPHALPGGHRDARLRFRVGSKSLAVWMAAGAALVALPYGISVARHYSDAIGQAVNLGDRARFDQLEFYVNNIGREYFRYQMPWQHVTEAVAGADGFFSPALLIVGIGPALIGLWRRMRRRCDVGDRLLGLSVLIFVALLALLEQTKAPLYAIVLLPSVCMALSAFWRDVWGWAWGADRSMTVRIAVAGLTIGLLGLVAVEGARAYRLDRSQSRQVSPYLVVGQRIHSHLTPGARVLGSERWWWALRDHPYLSESNLSWTWLSKAVQGQPTEFARQVAAAQIDFIIVNDNIRGGLTMHPSLLQDQFWNFLKACSQRVADWTDATHGWIEIYQVAKGPSGTLACQ